VTQDNLTRDIEVTREGEIMLAVFARPQKKNVITGAMYEALIGAFDTLGAIPKSALFW
jgi:enoyl-CoA hydratase/carnithine racemase